MTTRFTLEMALRDNMTGETLRMAVNVDQECRISVRAVQELKTGFLFDMTAAVEMMRRKEYRKTLFQHAAAQLGARLAERMEDAEGWHDTSRIDPARKELGGRWEP